MSQVALELLDYLAGAPKHTNGRSNDRRFHCCLGSDLCKVHWFIAGLHRSGCLVADATTRHALLRNGRLGVHDFMAIYSGEDSDKLRRIWRANLLAFYSNFRSARLFLATDTLAINTAHKYWLRLKVLVLNGNKDFFMVDKCHCELQCTHVNVCIFLYQFVDVFYV